MDLHRFEAAKQRKTMMLDTIRKLDLPNNPLDDIIDQVKVIDSSYYEFPGWQVLYLLGYEPNGIVQNSIVHTMWRFGVLSLLRLCCELCEFPGEQ